MPVMLITLIDRLIDILFVLVYLQLLIWINGIHIMLYKLHDINFQYETKVDTTER